MYKFSSCMDRSLFRVVHIFLQWLEKKAKYSGPIEYESKFWTTFLSCEVLSCKVYFGELCVCTYRTNCVSIQNTDFIALITILSYKNPRQKTWKDWYRIFSGNKCKIAITKFMVLWKISLLEQNSCYKRYLEV